MKIFTIPDLHGKTFWMEKDLSSYDKVIFLGDYVDSFDHSNIEILHCLNSVLNYKRDNPDKAELLWGNHDMGYIGNHTKCSGYRYIMAPDLYRIFKENEKFFNVAYQYKNTIWSHAGICKSWYNTLKQYNKELTDENLVEYINQLYYTHDSWLLEMVGHSRGGGEMPGILWADKQDLIHKPISGFDQVVGHSKVKDVREYNINGNKIVFTDCLDEVENYYIFED